MLVDEREIAAAVRDVFLDTRAVLEPAALFPCWRAPLLLFLSRRAVLEPAGAVAIAGLKKYVDAIADGSGSKGNYVAISSDASNIEFDILRFIAERASIGESREKLFAMKMPDKTGMFFDMYKAVQPRLVTEFVSSHSISHAAPALSLFP